MRRAVFLDRDGVINRAVIRNGKPHPPASLEELAIIPDAGEALRVLKDLGFVLIVVTNQPDVARGVQSRDVVEAINDRLREALPIDDIFVCYHDDSAACACRKPKPGLLLAAAAKWEVRLDGSYMIGDRWKDIAAGQAAGCATVWIDCGYAEHGPLIPASAAVKSLPAAAEFIRKHCDLEPSHHDIRC